MTRNPDTFAEWVLKRAKPAALIDLAFPRGRQVIIARTLGVPQSSVSDWKRDKIRMSRQVRTHILRILGVCWHDGAWRLCETIIDVSEPQAPENED